MHRAGSHLNQYTQAATQHNFCSSPNKQKPHGCARYSHVSKLCRIFPNSHLTADATSGYCKATKASRKSYWLWSLRRTSIWPRKSLSHHLARQCLDLCSQPLENWIPKEAPFGQEMTKIAVALLENMLLACLRTKPLFCGASSIVLTAGHQRRTTALSCGQWLCHLPPVAAFKPAPRPGAVDASATMEHGEASADHLAPATAIRCVLRFAVALMCLTRLSCMVPRSQKPQACLGSFGREHVQLADPGHDSQISCQRLIHNGCAACTVQAHT